MTNPLKIFQLRKEEKWLALAALLIFTVLNALMIGSHWAHYTEGASGGFWTLFVSRFNMSGYDCWSWLTVSGMRIHFQTIRHPLYLTFLYPMYLFNHWQMGYTDVNLAVFMIGAVLIFSAVYSAVFVYRILREVLSLRRRHAVLLVALLFSFGHAMIPPMVPDHFIISMMLLTMTVYIACKRMETGRTLKAWQTMLLVFFTSGIASSNGAKTMLTALFVNGRKTFGPKFLAVAFVLPLAVLLAIQRYQYDAFERPQAVAIAKIQKAKDKKKDTAREAEQRHHKKWVKQNDMQHADEDGLLYLMDFSTPRVPAIIENFLGESILLHQDYALHDVFKDRPAVVRYRHGWEYAIIGLVMLLFVAGTWPGRRQPAMQMLLCWFGLDVLLHIVLGFAINEVYIMASGWVFIIPIAIGYILKSVSGKGVLLLEATLLLLALFLWVRNGATVVGYLT